MNRTVREGARGRTEASRSRGRSLCPGCTCDPIALWRVPLPRRDRVVLDQAFERDPELRVDVGLVLGGLVELGVQGVFVREFVSSRPRRWATGPAGSVGPARSGGGHRGGRMAALTNPRADEQAYRDHERSVLAMLSTRYRDLDPDGRRELYHEAWASVLIALGGTSYAVSTIGTKEIKNNSVRSIDVRNGQLTSRDVKRGSLGGRAVKESALGTVPRANRLGGKTASQLTLRCPPGMQPNMDSCIEPTPRPALAYGFARVACESARRRLPSYQELISFTDTRPGLLPRAGS